MISSPSGRCCSTRRAMIPMPSANFIRRSVAQQIMVAGVPGQWPTYSITSDLRTSTVAAKADLTRDQRQVSFRPKSRNRAYAHIREAFDDEKRFSGKTQLIYPAR
jgi:hypothetical protein